MENHWIIRKNTQTQKYANILLVKCTISIQQEYQQSCHKKSKIINRLLFPICWEISPNPQYQFKINLYLIEVETYLMVMVVAMDECSTGEEHSRRRPTLSTFLYEIAQAELSKKIRDMRNI